MVEDACVVAPGKKQWDPLCNAKESMRAAFLQCFTAKIFRMLPAIACAGTTGLVSRSRTVTTITGYSTNTQHGDRIAPALEAAEERGH
jgi:hypothetical protein